MLFGTQYCWKYNLRNGTWYWGAAAYTNKMAFFGLIFFLVGGIMPTPGTSSYQHTPPQCFQACATSFTTAWPRSMFSLAIFIYLKFITSLSKLAEFYWWGTCFLQCLWSLWLQHQHFKRFVNGWCYMKKIICQLFRGGIDQPHCPLVQTLTGYQYQNRKWSEKC